MPAAWGGGAHCKCPGVAQCAHPDTCCKRAGALARARALRREDGTRQTHYTRCLGCFGLEGRPAAMRRPAAAAALGDLRPAAKAKAQPVPAALLLPQLPPAPPPPLALPDGATALTAALAVHTAALEAHTVALDRNTAASATLMTTLAKATVPAPLDYACPESLQPLKRAMETTLRSRSAPQGADILRAARAWPTTALRGPNFALFWPCVGLQSAAALKATS